MGGHVSTIHNQSQFIGKVIELKNRNRTERPTTWKIVFRVSSHLEFRFSATQKRSTESSPPWVGNHNNIQQIFLCHDMVCTWPPNCSCEYDIATTTAMIEYFRGPYGTNLLFRWHGSALAKAFLPGLFSVSIYLSLHYVYHNDTHTTDPGYINFVSNPYAIGVLVSSVSFLIIFRANYGYARYWEACTTVHQVTQSTCFTRVIITVLLLTVCYILHNTPLMCCNSAHVEVDGCYRLRGGVSLAEQTSCCNETAQFL